MEFFLTYILPIIIFAVAALLFGALLAFAGQKFAVKEDPRVKETNSLLPGTNCGGCGYPGCEGFAKALVEGQCCLEGCRPVKKENKEKICSLLGLSGGGGEEMVAVINCAGGHNCKDKFEYRGYGSCDTAEFLAKGSKACIVGCMGLGTCQKYCGYNAIDTKKNGHAIVVDPKCVTCGACLNICPKNLISLIPRSAPVYVACASHQRGKDIIEVCSAGCIACNKCAKVCEPGAITMVEELPVFDYSKCDACLKCVGACPTKVIKSRV
jgi:Na+-translocating ferredoxin:NAD+ oxidoreductase RNF subunit RnfB